MMMMRRVAASLMMIAFLSGVAQASGTPAPRQPTADGMGKAPESETKTPATQNNGASHVTRSTAPLPEPEIFATPTGNIGCVFTPAGGSRVYVPADGGPELACDIVQPRYMRATLSASGPVCWHAA